MTYLSRRMREEGFWLKRTSTTQCGEVTVTITCDVSKAVRSFERAATAAGAAAKIVADFARLSLDVELDPEQEAMIEAAFARRPDGSWKWERLSTRPPVLVDEARLYFASSAPDGSGGLAELVAKIHEAGEQTLAREWPDEELEYWPRQNGKSARFNREYLNRERLGIWPTPREDC